MQFCGSTIAEMIAERMVHCSPPSLPGQPNDRAFFSRGSQRMVHFEVTQRFHVRCSCSV